MKISFCAVILALAAPAFAAETSLETLSASSNLTMPSVAQFAPVAPLPARGRPGHPGDTVPGRLPDGSMSGTIGGVQVGLTFSRREGRIYGSAEQRTVELAYQPDGNTVSGSAFGQGLTATTTLNDDGTTTVDGSVRGMKFKYTVDDANHNVKGAIGGRELTISFDPAEGTANGAAGGSKFELTSDTVSGETTGTIQEQAVKMTLVNEGVGGVLLHLYLFVK